MSMPTDDAGVLQSIARTWRPPGTESTDPMDAGPAAALSAMLDLPAPAAVTGQPIPPLWHWLHFLSSPRQSELGVDGHLRDGHFLPPIPQRRRMFAGGRLKVHTPLLLGTPAQLASSVKGVELKQGRSGELLFVTVQGEFRQGGVLCATEEVDLVYRSGGQAPVPAGLSVDTDTTPASDAPWQSPWGTDPSLLFRFSALTANAHRIHYDAPYTTGTEGYPGLVVHGPLLVLSMLELVRREAPGRAVRTLSYRLRTPAFCGERLLTCGEETGVDAEGTRLRLWVAGSREDTHATAEVSLA